MKARFINHGQKEMSEESTWEINQGDIIVTVGNMWNGGPSDNIKYLTIQVNSASGPILKTVEDTESGRTIRIESENRIVVCTVIKISYTERTALLLVTENILD